MESAQSLRLKEFIDDTGMTVSQFGKQCGFASASTLHNVISKGKTPSQKVLEKIIKRFPQLNYDWVVLGYGEMIVKGFAKYPVSANSLQRSTDASFGTIQESLRNHDYSLNELAKMINTAILKSEQTNEILISKVDSLVDKKKVMHELFFEKAAAKTIERDELIRKSLQKYADNLVQRVELKMDQKYENYLQLITNLDAERKALLKKMSNEIQKAIESVFENSQNNTKKALIALDARFEELKQVSENNRKEAIETFKPVLGQLSKNKKP